MARDVAGAGACAVLFAFREVLERAQGRAGADHQRRSTARCVSDALGEVARGQEVVEFACGIPHLLKGGVLRVGVHRHRRALDPPAARGRRRDHAVQLPGDGPDVDVSRSRSRAATRSSSSRANATRRRRLGSPSCGPRPGLPAGVFTVLHGDKEAVDGLLTHPDVRAVSFVGSTPIARYVYETAAAHGKRVQALGGAKNHMVVLPDADLEAAADAAVSAGYGSRRRALHGDLGGGGGRAESRDALVDAIADAYTRGARSGAGDDAGCRDGPARHGGAPRSGARVRRRGRGRGRDAGRRRSRARLDRPRRLLPRAVPVRPT